MNIPEKPQNTKSKRDRMWADRELRNSSEDRFGFAEYVDVLRDRILNTETPSTIGIQGSWGSGKSTLMGLIDESVKVDKEVNERVKTIWINVWELGTQEEVWHAFLQAIFSKVYKKVRWWRKINWRKLVDKAIRSSWRVLVVAAPAIAAVYLSKSGKGDWKDVLEVISLQSKNNWGRIGGVTTQILALITLYKPAIDAVRKSVKFDISSVLKAGTYEAQISELMKLRDRFAKVVKLAVGAEGRIVVFIDDLDRCTPDKVPEVLEAIKLFASTEGCVYVLAFDQSVVAGRVAKKYGFDLEEGLNYLEKIVQVPFHLPPLAQTDIEQFIEADYKELRSIEPAVFARGLNANPRTVKRALNTYRIILRMAEKRVAAWEIDPLDSGLVAKMVVIQTRFKKLHAHLIDAPEYLLEIEKWALDSEKNPKPAFGTSVDPQELSALKAMLSAGGASFEDHKESLRWYIFLGGDAVRAEDELRPDRKYRDALLSNDPKKIDTVLEQILSGYTDDYLARIRATYRQRLRDILGDDGKYNREQRLSATLALDKLDQRKRHYLGVEPATVRVPGRDYLLGGKDEEYVNSAKDAGIQLALTKENQAFYSACPRDFRIGRYPVTNEEFAQFVLWLRSGSSVFRLDKGIVECEAYWRPCQPQRRWDWTFSKTPASFQVSCEPDDEAKTEPCVFRREDGTEVGEVTVILEGKRLGGVSGKVDQTTRAVRCSLRHKELSGAERTESFFSFFPGPIKQEPEASGLLQITSSGTKAVYETSGLLVRIRIMDSEGKEFSALPAPDQAFEVDITLWDRLATPHLRDAEHLKAWRMPEGKGKHPVTDVTWEDALLYCGWLRNATGIPYRLPTEIEWELAAAGETQPERLFPWGNDWDSARANTMEDGPGRTTPVDQYPQGDSAYCCADMAGNVWEWCADSYSETFEVERTGITWQDVKLHGQLATESEDKRSLRGGSYAEDKQAVICSNRIGRTLTDTSPTIGFRVAVSSGWE